MAEDRRTWSRRAVLAVSATGGASAIASALTGNENGNLYGGKMALNEAYNVAENLWIGPDSAKSNVDAKSGRVYMASDTQVEYYGDSGSWTKLGVGSSSEPVPSVYTEQVSVDTPGYRDVPASSYATSGTGDKPDPYTDGLDAAINDLTDGSSDYSVTILVDGFWNENVDLTNHNHVTLESSHWLNRIEGNTGSHTIDLGATDNVLRGLWIKGPGDTSFDALHADGSTELSIEGMLEVSASGTTRRLASFINVNDSFVDRLWLEGGSNNSVQLYLKDCTDFQLHGVLSDRDDVLIDEGNAQVQFGNIHIRSGKLEFTPTSSNGVRDIGISNLYVSGPGRGIFFNGGNTERVTIENAVIDNNANYGIEFRGTNNHVSGIVTNNTGNGQNGVRFGDGTNGATRCSFYGTAQGNGATDVQMESDATECVAYGAFDSAFMDDASTRCVINGLSKNQGDPSSTGDWNGNANLAHDLGVTVIDINNEGDLYVPLHFGATNDWVRVSGTAV